MTTSLLQDAVLVTGAGRRVGLHLAERMMALGHPVVAHYRTLTDDVERLRAAGAACLPGDLAEPDGGPRLAAAVRGVAGSLRAVIHNASAFEVTAVDTGDALRQLDVFYAVHVRAPFALNRELAPLLDACSARRADIVHITDIYADNPNPAFDAYCASKAGLQNLALSFAKRLAPKVKVNVVQPGPILFKEWHGPEARARVLSETLLGDEGGVEAIGLAVEAILRNHYQTGAVVAVDGGRRLA
ncbi:SDR family NAD(P)-dependent oxidoreductase [Azospirillum argentinense]|uniref:SDR family NAD(P)-dependent oxidoreductase n=1 Tax=Azospirillum argentinense TaxID=2970906 RepID=UPI00190ED2CB|nr:SDR family NAD(P)-dependent oxidoreductase [Azospirillum argentinense]MBK3802792.1 SDR family NAD(P)-dependent oxidoreductase [Azospirillum argentinense]